MVTQSSAEWQLKIRQQYDSFCKTLLKHEMIDYESSPPFSWQLFMSTEDEMLRDEHSEPIRNRFTAYLVVAVTNKRIRYMSKQKRIYAKEIYIPELLEIEEQDVETQYFNFLSDQGTHLIQDWERFEEWFRSSVVLQTHSPGPIR